MQKLVEQVLRLHKENLSLQAKNAEIEQQMKELLIMKEKLQEELFIVQGSPFKVNKDFFCSYALLLCTHVHVCICVYMYMYVT